MNSFKLIETEGLSSQAISKIKSPYEKVVVKKANIEKYIENGWEQFKVNKKSITMRKPKKDWIAFEDKVWGMIAEMGFQKVNELRNFKIEYAPGLTKQIDVFAFDDEAILIIECKSTPERRRVNFQKEINEFIALKDKLRDAVKVLSDKPKVAFIFATNNAIISKTDRLRIEDAAKSDNFYHFNQDTIEYYEQLSILLGKAAKYQLLGNLFQGQKVPGLEIKVPALKSKFSAGFPFYSFCINPYDLMKTSTSFIN